MMHKVVIALRKFQEKVTSWLRGNQKLRLQARGRGHPNVNDTQPSIDLVNFVNRDDKMNTLMAG